MMIMKKSSKQIVHPAKSKSEPKLSKDTLRSARSYKARFEKANDAIFIADMETGYILDANAAAGRLLGRPVGEITGMHQSDLHPKDKFKRQVKGGGFYDFEAEIVREDRSIIPVQISTSVYKVQGQKLIQGIFKDISKLKEAEKIMQLSQATLNKFKDTVVWLNSKGRYVYVNDATCKRFGYSRDEILSMYVYDFNPMLFKGKWPTVWAELKQKGSITTNGLHRTETGELIPVEIIANYMEHNGFEYSCAIARDITERKRTQQILKESEKRYRELANLLPAMVFDIDDKGNFTFANHYAFEVTGYTPKDIAKGLNTIQMVIPEDRERILHNMRRVLAGEKSGGYEYTVLKKDGGTFPAVIYSAPIVRDNKTIGLRGIVIDISRRKRDELKLLEYHKELRALASQLSLAEERQRRFIATEIHDLVGQQLAVCRLKLGEMIESGYSATSDKTLEEINNIIKQVISELRLLIFEISPPLLYEFGLETALEFLSEQIHAKHGIRVDFKSDTQPKPLDDDVRILLFQVVRELLTNITKHSKAHKAVVYVTRYDHNIRILVEDDGVGFDTAIISHSFMKNEGFGLFSIRERLHYIGGHIEIESEPNCGTRVTLMAPLKHD